MKTSRAPKIVIGVGLLAVYAVILSMAILRDERPGAAAPNVPAATDAYSATDLQTSPAALPLPSGPVTTAAEQPAATPEPASPTGKTDASRPEIASIANESQPVEPSSEVPADTGQIAAEANVEDAAPLVVGN